MRKSLALIALGALVGCTPKVEAMPVLVQVSDGHDVVVTIPVCPGDRLLSVAVVDTTRAERPSINYSGSGPEVATELLELKVVLSVDTLESGEIVDGLLPGTMRVFRELEGELPVNAMLFATTYDTATAIRFDTFLGDARTELIVRGTSEADSEYRIDAGSVDEWRRQTSEFCASIDS